MTNNQNNQQPTATPVTPEVAAAPKVLSDAEFLALLDQLKGNIGVQQPQKYTYEVITDLYIPGLSQEDYEKALDLANRIEMLKVSIFNKREEKKVITDAELDNLDAMKRAYQDLTGTGAYASIKTAGKKALGYYGIVINAVEERSTELVNNVFNKEGLLDTAVDGVVDIASSTLKLSGALVKSVSHLGADLTTGTISTIASAIKPKTK